jgi:hypothetical protein
LDRRSFLSASTAVVATSVLPLPENLSAQQTPSHPSSRGPAYRQVHLDFHTSDLITDVAADFDARQFAETLQRAHVNSINLFAKCSHGWAYYDTKIAHKHPHLKIDLLAEQMAAVQALGIATHYYYSLVWDVRSALANPEWRSRNKDGSGLSQGYWLWMCMNTPYLDQVIAENAEILDRFQVAGVIWDILIQPPNGCYCQWCVAERKRLGLSDSHEDIFHQNKLVALKTEKRLFDLIKSKQPDAQTFFNSRLVVGISDELQYYNNLQIESLPTGGWGYGHFEHRVRYCRTLGKQMVGMTGRFHKSWGDFGGFKPQAALNFECMNFLANGAAACVGDQLHPRGALDPMTYNLIGTSYERVERQESWLNGMRGVADIGVVSSLATAPDMAVQEMPPTDEGFTNMLVELHHQFDVLDLNADLSPYKLIILPDNVAPVSSLVEKIKRYVVGGGHLIVTYKSLLNEQGTAFAMDEIGIRPLGPSRYKGEYLLPRKPGLPNVPNNAYFLYQQGLAIAAQSGVETLAVYGHPYFDRSPEHWCSHAQTPFSHITDEPVITRAGRVVYCANPLFASYSLDGELVYKTIMADLINSVLTRPVLRSESIPSTARLTLMKDPTNGNHLVQILYAPYERRAPRIDIIEEEASFSDGKVWILRNSPPTNVRSMDGKGRVATLTFRYSDGYVELMLPRVTGQLAVLLS